MLRNVDRTTAAPQGLPNLRAGQPGETKLDHLSLLGRQLRKRGREGAMRFAGEGRPFR